VTLHADFQLPEKHTYIHEYKALDKYKDSYNPEIIIGTETWLNDSVHNSEIFPPNYNIYRRDRRDGFGRVLIAVKADIVSEHLDVKINTESVYTSITLEKGPLSSWKIDHLFKATVLSTIE
jgi:hypothetical protein